MVHCPACGTVPVPEAELPVLLPALDDFAPDGTGRSPLARCEAFVDTPCPQCGDAARRETDVSDNFLDSAWYFFRYPSADDTAQAFDRERTQRWLPVDMYIGGNEHAVLHLIYTRFLTMALRDMGLIDFEEPFKRFRANGMIVKDGAKMSKSKGNVVNPDEYLDRYGTDALRTYLMFAGNFQEGGDFRDQSIHGVQRFLDRLWRYANGTRWDDGDIADAALLQLLHQKIHKVTEDLEHLHYNTAIPALMELLTGLQEGKRHYRRAIKTLLQLVAPFAPCITQELWQSLGETGQVADAAWPQADPALMHQERIEWIVQVNGRRRDRLDLAADLTQQEVEAVAFSSERVRALLEDKQILKTIFVPQKLVNIVVR
jgi:leucyl-tRNA synthetase